MDINALTAVSPIDGRYSNKVADLRPILSEYGLIRFRVEVEIHWLIALTNHADIQEAKPLDPDGHEYLTNIIRDFDEQQAAQIKEIETHTNHDVKAVEYFLRDKLTQNKKLRYLLPFIHFGCTSEDINNLAYALMLKEARKEILSPMMQKLIDELKTLAKQNAKRHMLARTHGQPASPTTLGKEIINFAIRLQQQLERFHATEICGKFNGAVGNFNAHRIAYPEVDWPQLCRQFVTELGLGWNGYTTQIEPHDNIAELLQALMRFNTVLIDLDRDVWGYISLGYFIQKQVEQEVGSSTMPHKINPIDFENSEGNLGLANAIADHLASKLPISRWQRDLTDSTSLRNLGNVFAYSLIAYQATEKGLKKLEANEARMVSELNQHWEVLAEAIQTTMRRYGIVDAYEQLKAFTRGKQIDATLTQNFIQQLKIPEEAKKRLLELTPHQYTGYADELTKDAL